MQIIIPILEQIDDDERIMLTFCHVINFYYLSCYEIHNSCTLERMDEELKKIENYIQVFVDSSPTALNFPKLHSLSKYSEWIRNKGKTMLFCALTCLNK